MTPKSPLEQWIKALESVLLEVDGKSPINRLVLSLAEAIQLELQSIKTQLRLLDKEGVLKDEPN